MPEIDEFMSDETRALIRIEALLTEIRDALIPSPAPKPVKLVTEYPHGTPHLGVLAEVGEETCLEKDPDGLRWMCSLVEGHETRHEAMRGYWTVASWEK